jgi:hypothetical protein
MNDRMDLKFELSNIDGELIKYFSVDDCESWTNLVLSFADFLSAQYGYGISEKILFITDHPYGRETDYAISKNEYEMLLSYRKRDKALDSLFDDEEN